MHVPRQAQEAAMAADRPRDGGLDLLRGLAAVSVVLFHVWLYAQAAPPARAHGLADAFWSAGRLGLVLFFVLSGYLLYRPWIRARRSGDRPPATGAYLLRRAARVLPAYYLAFAGSLVLLAEAGGTPGVRLAPIEQLPLFVVFAQNLSPATIMKLDPPMWTLAVEVSFYLVLPLAGAIATRIRTPVLVPIAALLAGLAYDAAIAGHGLSQSWTKSLPALLPLFAAGMLVAHLPDDLALGHRARRLVLITAGLLVGADAAWHQTHAGYLGLVLRDLPAAAGFALLLLGARELNPTRSVAGRAFTWVGTVSFGLYLWHVPVLWWLRSVDLLPLNPLIALPVTFAPSLALAALSWYLVERPVMRRARRANVPSKRPRWQDARQPALADGRA
jgi:peptidoglycan/LPS O-acetylase OafA/YrhL